MKFVIQIGVLLLVLSLLLLAFKLLVKSRLLPLGHSGKGQSDPGLLCRGCDLCRPCSGRAPAV